MVTGQDPFRDEPATRAQVTATVAALRELLGDALAAVSLHGSAVGGGLTATSDVDLLALVRRRLTTAERRAIVERVLRISAPGASAGPAGRPIELTVVAIDDVRPWRYPPLRELQYGEWLRDQLAAGAIPDAPQPDPDLAILVTSVRSSGLPLFGARAADLLDAVPAVDLERAMRHEIPGLLADLVHDTRNVLLTLARIVATLATGEILGKDAAVDRTLDRLEPRLRPVLARARDQYRDGVYGPWDDIRPLVDDAANALAEAASTQAGPDAPAGGRG